MQAYIETLQGILANPASNLTGFVLLLAAALLLLLILLVVLLILIVPDREHDESADDGDSPARTESRTPARSTGPASTGGMLAAWRSLPLWLRLTGITLTLALMIGYAYAWTGTNDTCASACHAMSGVEDVWRDSTHATVDCARCHEGRSVLSLPTAAIVRTRYLLAATRDRSPSTPALPSERCLECHRHEISVTIETTGGIRMDHVGPLDSGIACLTCHWDAGHAATPSSAPSRMQICLPCHNGGTASAACGNCHTGDVGEHPIRARIYATPEIPAPDCTGCH